LSDQFGFGMLAQRRASNLYIGPMKKLLLSALLVILIVGCASADGPTFNTLSESKQSYGLFYFFRGDFGSSQSAYTPSLLIDGQKFVEIKRNAFTYIYIPEGVHELSFRANILSGYPSLDAKIIVRSGEKRFVEIFDPVSVSGRTLTYTSNMKEYKESDAVVALTGKKYEKPSIFESPR